MTKQELSKLREEFQALAESGNKGKEFFVKYQTIFQDIIYLVNDEGESSKGKDNRSRSIDVHIADLELRVEFSSSGLRFSNKAKKIKTSEAITLLHSKFKDNVLIYDNIIHTCNKESEKASIIHNKFYSEFDKEHEKLLKELENTKLKCRELYDENIKLKRPKKRSEEELKAEAGLQPLVNTPKTTNYYKVAFVSLSLAIISFYSYQLIRG